MYVCMNVPMYINYSYSTTFFMCDSFAYFMYTALLKAILCRLAGEEQQQENAPRMRADCAGRVPGRPAGGRHHRPHHQPVQHRHTGPHQD